MCTELGPGKPYLQQYVEEAGGTSLCAVATKKGCTEKEAKFIDTWNAKGASQEEIAKQAPRLHLPVCGVTLSSYLLGFCQVTRLEGMKGNSMKAELKEWLNQRLAIFKQMAKAGIKKEL